MASAASRQASSVVSRTKVVTRETSPASGFLGKVAIIHSPSG